MNDMCVTLATATKENTAPDRGHSLVATDRREITVKGVSEVISFDETLVRLVTTCGLLNLEGEGLRVRVLDLKSGTVIVTGQLNGVLYEADAVEEPSTRGKTRTRRLLH